MTDEGPGRLGALRGLRQHVRTVVESGWFQWLIVGLIAANAVSLGLETSPHVRAQIGDLLKAFDQFVLIAFCVEIGLKLFAQGWRFFRNGWNLFDVAVVGFALLPARGEFSILRALRILRVLRLISVVPQVRRVVGALVTSLPGMVGIMILLALVFYMFAVIATKLFGKGFPQWFGSIGESMYSLFQIMTLESWSMGIVRPVMEANPNAWLLFVPFILITSFAVLNLVIALIVNSMNVLHDEEVRERDKAERATRISNEHLLEEMGALRRELASLRIAAAGRGKTRKRARPGRLSPSRRPASNRR